MKKIMFLLLEVFMITGITFIFAFPISCRLTETGITIVKSCFECPELVSFQTVDSKNAQFCFSKEIKLSDIVLSPSVQIEKIDSINDESGYVVNLLFNQNLETGKEYVFFANAEDSEGNTLEFSVPLIGFNDNVPEMKIIGVHPKYSGETKGNGVFKNEFVKIKIIKGGNLSGLELVSAYDGDEKAFVFPVLNVCDGEVINVHLRSKGNGCINELGENLSLSTAKFSDDNERDLWDENENARLGDEMDVIVIRNLNTQDIVCAVLYAPKGSTEWKNDNMKEMALKVEESGLVKNASDVSCAVFSDGVTATKGLFYDSAWIIK